MSKEENENKIDPTVLGEKDYDNFYGLVQVLVDSGYAVNISMIDHEDGSYHYQGMSMSTGRVRGVRFAFCTPSDHVYKCLSGSICADSIDAFDKWTACPLKVPFPSTEEEESLLVSYLSWLGKVEGYEKSSSYDFEFFVQSYDQIKKLLTNTDGE